jgi:methyltransferase family protein
VKDFDARIEELDLSLFAAIDSQSDDGDRRSWLALQREVRRRNGSYAYLEIGSYRGGSLQPYLLDPRCRKILSIDNRPLAPPDDRGEDVRYEDNSTAGMLTNLRAVDPAQVAKVVCFESDAQEIDPARLPDRPDLCFIDGEHTQSAVLSDFDFCLRACSPRAILYFHDDWLISPALAEILRRLKRRGLPFTAFKLQGTTFAIALGTRTVPEDAFLRQAAVSGRRYLLDLRWRRWLKRVLPAFLQSFARRLRARVRGSR